MAGRLSRLLREQADRIGPGGDDDLVLLLRVAAERLERLGDLEGIPRAEGLQGRPAASFGGDTPAARELMTRAEYADQPPDIEETRRALGDG